MSAIPITQLPEINVTDPNALLVIVTSGTTYKIPFSALTATLINNVDEFYLPILSSNTTYVSSKIFQTPLGSVRVDNNPTIEPDVSETFGVHAGDTDSFLLINGTGSIDYALGITNQNTNSGHTASTDIVIIGDVGNFDTGYIDMGINSSTYSGFTGVTALGGASDAYLFSTANDLYIGNASSDKKVVLFNGGFETNLYSKFYMHEQGTITINGANYDIDNPDTLRVYPPQNSTYNLMTAFGNVDNYTQINLKNLNIGSNASTDIVATADNGTEEEFYINMGINGSNHSALGGIGAQNDGYVYSTGNDLYVGNASSGKRLILFNGGYDSELYAKFFVHQQGTITINGDGYDETNPDALRIYPPTDATYNMVTILGDIDYYSQLVMKNANSGTTASADIVATNDIGTETSYYVDMGINSSAHVPDYSYGAGEANDTYLLSVANNHYMGSSNNGTIIIFTGPNFDGYSNAKIILRPNNEHDLIGNTTISGNTTNIGNFSVAGGTVNFGEVIEASDNSDAILSGLTIGDVYRTGDFLKIVHL
jgi:hypothetical protein